MLGFGSSVGEQEGVLGGGNGVDAGAEDPSGGEGGGGE